MKKNNLQKAKTIIIGLFLFIGITSVYATIPLPIIPSTQFLITDYGATTSALNNANSINDAISAANAAGGGTVVIPAGTFLSGPISMKSNVNLYLSAGSTLRLMPYGSGNGVPAGSYPNNGTTNAYANFISGSGLNNIEVSGSGVIEGDGSAWWAAYKANSSIKRPCMIRFKACNTVLITGITLQNAPNVHVTLGQSSSMGSNGTISNITIIAPSTSPNTDAIDTWYWNGVNITNCNLSEGDDNVAMDSYSQNITITHCTFGSGHGVSVGSYAMNVKNVKVDSCTFNGTTNGIRLKSERGRGGADSTFEYSNITMNNVKYPFYITSWYPKEPYPASAQVAATVTSTTPAWNNITFKNITVTNSTNAGIIYGLPEKHINNVVFDNVKITATGQSLITNYVDGLVFKNCSSIKVSSGNAITPYAATISGINITTGASTSCSPDAVENVIADTQLTGFPNPMNGDNFTIKSVENISKIKIYTVAGKQLMEENGNLGHLISINLRGISAGYYLVNVQFENGSVKSLKLVKV